MVRQWGWDEMTCTLNPMSNMLMRNTGKISELLSALDTGATLGAAAEFSGLRSSTVKGWVAHGEKLLEEYETSDEEPLFHEKKLMELAVDVNQRMAAVEMKAAGAVMAAVDAQDWKAAAWILERKFKQNGWSSRTEVTGADGGALQVEDATKVRERVDTALSELHSRINEVEGMRAEVIVEAEEVEDVA